MRFEGGVSLHHDAKQQMKQSVTVARVHLRQLLLAECTAAEPIFFLFLLKQIAVTDEFPQEKFEASIGLLRDL